MHYEQFLKLARAYTHWKFNKPRINNGTAIVLIVDTFYRNDPKSDYVVIMDVKENQPDEPRVFNSPTALDFFTLYEKGIIEPFTPKI